MFERIWYYQLEDGVEEEKKDDASVRKKQEEKIKKEINQHIEVNKKDTVISLQLCNFIHNMCFFMLELIQYYDFTLIYPNASNYKHNILNFNFFFQMPLNFILPVLFGYARDFVNQVASIKISFSMIIIGMIFQYMAICYSQIQLSMIGMFIFMIGKEVFYLSGLCLIYDYYPHKQDFAVQLCYYSQYGWAFPRILVNILMILFDQIPALNNQILHNRGLILFNSIIFLFFEAVSIYGILKRQKILENSQEMNISEYKNPFRKHNIIKTLSKYFADIDFIQVTIVISLVIGLQNTQFISFYNTNLINYAQKSSTPRPDTLSFILSLIQATAQFGGCKFLLKRFVENYSFERIVYYFKSSGLLSSIFFLFSLLSSIQSLPLSLCFFISASANIMSGLSLSLSFFASENCVLYYQKDYMLGTGFGLASSFIMLVWTAAVLFTFYFDQNDNTFIIFTMICLLISFFTFIWQQYIGNKIIQKQSDIKLQTLPIKQQNKDSA